MDPAVIHPLIMELSRLPKPADGGVYPDGLDLQVILELAFFGTAVNFGALIPAGIDPLFRARGGCLTRPPRPMAAIAWRPPRGRRGAYRASVPANQGHRQGEAGDEGHSRVPQGAPGARCGQPHEARRPGPHGSRVEGRSEGGRARRAAAQKKLASGAGLTQADAAARKHVSTVQRLSAAYKDAAKNQALLGRGPGRSGRSWIQGELDALRRYRAEMRAVTKEAERLGVTRHRAERMARVPYGDRGRLGEAVAAGAIANNAGRATRYAVEQGAVTRQETNRQVIAGMEAKQIAELDRRATELSAQFPSVDATKIRVMGRDARNMFPTFEMAMKALPEMVRARVMLQAAKGVDAADNEMGDFLKGADILGKTEDLESFTRLLNSYTKAVQVEGRQLPLKEYKEFSKYSKAGGVNLSDEFMGAVAPTFMQSEGGGRFGTQIASGISSLISGKRTKRSTAALMELGLLDKKGNLKNAEKYQTNPYQYAIEDMMPALARKNINVDNDKAVQAYMSKIFSNSMTENLFTKLITQRAQVERNIKTYRGAKGLDAAKDQTRSDPYISWEAIVSQFRNIMGTTLDENVALAGKAGATLAENMGDLNKSLKERPATAQAVGAAGVATSGLIAGKAGLELWRWLGRTFGVGKQGAIGGSAGAGTGAATAAAEGAVAGTGSAAAATSTGPRP